MMLAVQAEIHTPGHHAAIASEARAQPGASLKVWYKSLLLRGTVPAPTLTPTWDWGLFHPRETLPLSPCFLQKLLLSSD